MIRFEITSISGLFAFICVAFAFIRVHFFFSTPPGWGGLGQGEALVVSQRPSVTVTYVLVSAAHTSG